MVHEQMSRFSTGFRRMPIRWPSCGLRRRPFAFYHGLDRHHDPHQRMVASLRMIAKMPTIAGWAYKYHIGQPFVLSEERSDYASTSCACVSRALRGICREPVLACAMDRIFILHADHEQNASTSTFASPLVGCQPVRLYRCRIACLWGLPMAAPTRRRSTCSPRSARSTHSGIYRPRQGQERSVPSDGLRPPGLQELRSAREDHAEGRRNEVLAELGHKDDPLLEVANGAPNASP